jgi:hypothetical protein
MSIEAGEYWASQRRTYKVLPLGPISFHGHRMSTGLAGEMCGSGDVCGRPRGAVLA